MYTDGSVWVDKSRAGYGVMIRYPDESASEKSGACREPVAYQAEKSAIVTSLNFHNTFFLAFPQRKWTIPLRNTHTQFKIGMGLA